MKSPLCAAIVFAAFAVVLAGFARADIFPEPRIETYQRFIGRDLVVEKRAINAGLHRTLPLSCPPFHLRDENGDIIDPTKDANGNPMDPNLPLTERGIPRAVSTRQTCGACHDYDTVTHGYHFQTGRDEMYPEVPPGDGQSPHRGPGFFGKWQLLYQRELAPKHFEDPNEIDMTPFEWVVSCGVCHPGGGPAEFDRGWQRYDRVIARDRGITTLGDSDYHESPWDKSGVVEADCFICHLESYEYSIRAQQIKKLNFKWAATAAAGIGYVWGAVAEGQSPKVYYDTSLFRADGTVHMHIRRPTDRQCMFCHDMSSVQKRGSTWHSPYMQDVHTEQGIRCIDCHHGDIRHNFAKGTSSSQTVRDDLDNTALSCAECHEHQERGAPDYPHPGLPPLHLERISCEACHITHRPFVPTAVVDTTTGKAIQLPEQIDPKAFDSYLFGANWGRVVAYDPKNILHPYTPAELDAAANLMVQPGDALRDYFGNADGTSRLPQGAFRVRDFIETHGGLASEDALSLMLFALEATAPHRENMFPVGVFRGQAWQLEDGWVKEIPTTLQPKRPGATIAETPFILARSKGDGIIHPEGQQLGAFWAYLEGPVARPVFLKDMDAAWQFLTSEEYRFYQYPHQPAAGGISPGLPREGEAGEQETAEKESAEASPMEAPPAEAVQEVKTEEDPRATREAAQAATRKLQEAVKAKLAPYGSADRRRIAIYDDNNDSFPEINTEAEMAVMAWAISEVAPRFKGRDLYYIKGVNAWRVHVEDWQNPYDADYLQMDRIGENEAFIAVERYEQEEVPGAFSWDPPALVWQLTETRLARPYKATVEKVDTAANAAIGALAQRLPWTVSHGIEPATSALGAKGCADCHSADSHFFFGPVVIDPFGPDAKPITAPMYELLGYEPFAIRIGAFREEILKPVSPWIVLAVLLIMLLHFALIGRKNGVAYPTLDVLRFRVHERLSHLIAMTTVVVLAVTGFFFLLGRHDPLGPWARVVHTYVGYASIVGIIAIFLSWMWAMFPAKGDLRWLLKAGGYLGGVKEHLPAGKFNAGQKILFWIAIAACGVLAASGVLMGLNRGAHFPRQELVYTAHDIAALIMILVLMAHVYLAAFVVPHSINSLFGGKVSSKWADAHHANWQYKGKTTNPSHDKHQAV